MAAVSPGRKLLEYAKLRSDLVYYGPASNRNKRERDIYRERRMQRVGILLEGLSPREL